MWNEDSTRIEIELKDGNDLIQGANPEWLWGPMYHRVKEITSCSLEVLDYIL